MTLFKPNNSRIELIGDFIHSISKFTHVKIKKDNLTKIDFHSGEFTHPDQYSLESSDGTQFIVSSDANGASEILEYISKLPNLDQDAFEQAIRCTTNTTFTLWKTNERINDTL